MHVSASLLHNQFSVKSSLVLNIRFQEIVVNNFSGILMASLNSVHKISDSLNNAAGTLPAEL